MKWLARKIPSRFWTRGCRFDDCPESVTGAHTDHLTVLGRLWLWGYK